MISSAATIASMAQETSNLTDALIHCPARRRSGDSAMGAWRSNVNCMTPEDCAMVADQKRRSLLRLKYKRRGAGDEAGARRASIGVRDCCRDRQRSKDPRFISQEADDARAIFLWKLS
jgi:hypothetical protein